jgi:5'-3' exonuclease
VLNVLNVRNIDEYTRNELLKIYEDWYKLIDIVDEKLQVPRIPPEWRAKLEKEKSSLLFNKMLTECQDNEEESNKAAIAIGE